MIRRIDWRLLRSSASLLIMGLLIVGLILNPPHRDQAIPELPVSSVRTSEMPIFYAGTKEKVMALTFDISWGHETVHKVLPILEDHRIKATFFLSGPWSQQHEQIVREIAGAGHEIASHGGKHVNLSQYDKATIQENIGSTDEILRKISGQQPRYFRPPNGDYDDLVITTARELGYETVIWSIDSLDWKNPGPEYMIDRVTREAFPGAIILFHASDSSKQTHIALPFLFKKLDAMGYRLTTLADLLEKAPAMRDDPRGRPQKPNQ